MKYYKDFDDGLVPFHMDLEVVKYQDDTIVTPYVAELLEEIGFRNPNMGRYVTMYNKSNSLLSNEKLGYQGEHWRLAPTQTQAQAWFRDYLKVDLNIIPTFMDNTKSDFKYYYYIFGYDDVDDEDVCYFDTYEDAMECGLIKISKLVKNETK